MTDHARPLDVARADLDQRLNAADRAGDWREYEILSPLASVADMVCRIGDHPDSAHYRASKAGPLVDAALRVHLACMQAYLGADAGPAVDELAKAHDIVGQVVGAVRTVMWAIAQGAHGEDLTDDEFRRLRQATAELSAWAEAGPTRAGVIAEPAAARTGWPAAPPTEVSHGGAGQPRRPHQ